MEIPLMIVLLGVLIFFSHISNALFNKTKIPNVLLLLMVGILIGPLTGWLPPDFFGGFGPVFTTITLIVILFESGIGLKFSEIKKAIGPALAVTFMNFILGMGIGAIVARLFIGEWLPSLFLGAIIGGTSSAVVIPMVKQLKMDNRNQTILFLESALSDVLCLVVGLALLEGMKSGNIETSSVFNKMWQSFLFAALIGVGAAFAWSYFLNLVRSIKNSMFTSLAFVFLLYGLVELIGFNGGIASLCFGIILGNTDSLNGFKSFRKLFKSPAEGINEKEKNFFSEIVFVFQTYFFVYVGFSIKFGNPWLYMAGLLIVLLIIVARPFTIRMVNRKKGQLKDIVIMSIMAPKGLVPAVLASIPLQLGIAKGEVIQDLGYSVVLFSIVICSILVIIVSKDPLFFIRLWRKKKEETTATELPEIKQEDERLEKEE